MTADEELRGLFELHLFGPAALVRAVLPGMRERGSRAIVQMSSYGGEVALPGFSAYSATKFALEGFSEAMAAEVGPLGIQVLVVEPGAFAPVSRARGCCRASGWTPTTAPSERPGT